MVGQAAFVSRLISDRRDCELFSRVLQRSAHSVLRERFVLNGANARLQDCSLIGHFKPIAVCVS